MRIDVRTTAVAAGVAFGLSALIGMIGGVQFGVLLLRALIIAAIFGGGAIGVMFLIDRFLPELQQLPDRSANVETGGSVDIVVDDDPLAGDGLPAQLPEYGSEGADEDTEVLPVDDGGDEGEGLSDTDELSGDSDDTEPAFEPGIAADEVRTETGSEEDLEELAEESDAESLPDMERMSDSFVAPVDSEETSGTSETNAYGGDPSMYAQAIRTALKRDEG